MCCSEGLDVKIYLQQLWQDDDGDGDNGDDDNGQEGTSGAVKLYLQQMSQLLLLTVIWLSLQLTNYLAGKHLYLTRYHSCTFVFVFQYTYFLYFRICIWPNIIFVLLSLLHQSKYTVLDAPYFRKGHLATFSLVGGKQTPQSPNQSMWHKRKHE